MLGQQRAFLYAYLRASMEKYLLSEPVPISPMRRKNRWLWLALGCFCLVVGGVYLSTADLTNGAGVAERQEILTSIDEAP